MATSEPVAERSAEPAGGRGAEWTADRPTTRVIAADRAVNAERWTIGAFDTGAPTRRPETPRVAAEHLPTADEVTAIEQQARDDGYRAGLAEARDGNARIASLLTGLSASVARLERDMAQTLVKLAVDLARQVVRESLVVRPDLIVPVVQEALSGIARISEPGGVFVHPDDLPIVAERLGDALAHGGWKAFADERIARGGCRLEFAGGQVDATIETRWSRVMGQLERHDAWLE